MTTRSMSKAENKYEEIKKLKERSVKFEENVSFNEDILELINNDLFPREMIGKIIEERGDKYWTENHWFQDFREVINNDLMRQGYNLRKVTIYKWKMKN